MCNNHKYFSKFDKKLKNNFNILFKKIINQFNSKYFI